MLKSSLVIVLIVAAGAAGFGAYRWYAAGDSNDSVARPDPAVLAGDGAMPQPATTPAAAPKKKMASTRPVFTLRDRAGTPRSIAEWDGKSLVINFWATWCAPCRREIPMLRELHATRAAQNFEVIGVAVDVRENVLAYASKMQIDYPVLIGEQDGLDAAAAFGIDAIAFPFTVFTDNQGRIVTAHLGELHRDEADLILDTVVAINAGTVSLADGQQRIAAGLQQAGLKNARG